MSDDVNQDRMVSANRAVVLLGPQRENPQVRKAVADVGALGPLAVVSAGWEERESEDEELAAELAGQTINLALFPRAYDLYQSHPDLHQLVIERETRRKKLRDLYHLRLAPQLAACRRLLDETDPAAPDDIYGPEIDDAIEAVRQLDSHHLARIAALEAEIRERLEHNDHGALARHRHEITELIDRSGALLIAGGHVGTLIAMLRLFNVMSEAAAIPVVAWSAGAMAVGSRVVLFHDSPARGAGDAEVFGPGFGLVDGVIAMPHARHRLDLDDARRVSLMARRFAPCLCVGLDYTGRIDRVHQPSDAESSDDEPLGWQASGTAFVLQENGAIISTQTWHDEAAEGDGSETGGDNGESTEIKSDPSDEIHALATAASDGPEALSRALSERSFPVVGDGWALYVYVGAADSVKLHHWVSGLPSAQPFSRLEGTDLWTFVGQLQRRARVEYKLEVTNGHHTELVQDPLNPNYARDPFGANSVVGGPDYRRPEWADEQATARRGTVVDHESHSSVFGQSRPYRVYLPARYRPGRRYPLLVVHDGIDYLQYAALTTVLDNLIHRLEIPPVIAALTQSPDRLAEYGANPAHGRFITEDLVPDLERRYPLMGPSDRVLLGASFGAVASLHTAWSHPGSFGKLLLQSGSFAFTDVGTHDFGPPFDPVVEFVNQFRQEPGRPADRIYLSAGVYESLIYFNRSLLPVLQQTGAEVRMTEAADGHNWENWRDHLRDGLTWLLPGPQWLVYE